MDRESGLPPDCHSECQKGLATDPMDSDDTGTGRPAGSPSRPIGTQRHLTQLLEGRALTIHQPVRLELNAAGDPSTMDFTGVLHRQEKTAFLLIQANPSQFAFHGPGGEAKG